MAILKRGWSGMSVESAAREAMPGRTRRLMMIVLPMSGSVMWGCLVMKAQEIHAVVVAVGCPDDGMDVKFLRFGIVQNHSFMVVELNHHHRALNAIIERAFLTHAAGPAEMSLREVPFHVARAGRKRPGRQRG